MLPLPATVPRPVILVESALLTAQVSTEGPPANTEEGTAENVAITGRPVLTAGGAEGAAAPLTVSTAVAELLPYLLVAVSV